MRRSPLSQIFAALLAVWFTYSFASPPSEMRNMVMGSGAPMNMLSNGMSAASMADMPQSGAEQAAVHADTQQNVPKKSNAPQCDHRDCCCSAISPSMVTPQSSLAWLPEHVIEQALPPVGTNVFYSEGQVLLPFANGPPNTVTA
ncbi:MAG: hypothetical protein ABJC26_15275 [Gemmatimonadaceae bacterium]